MHAFGQTQSLQYLRFNVGRRCDRGLDKGNSNAERLKLKMVSNHYQFRLEVQQYFRSDLLIFKDHNR